MSRQRRSLPLCVCGHSAGVHWAPVLVGLPRCRYIKCSCKCFTLVQPVGVLTDREFIQLYAEAPRIVRASMDIEGKTRLQKIIESNGMIKRAFLFAVTEREALHTAYACTPKEQVTT